MRKIFLAGFAVLCLAAAATAPLAVKHFAATDGVKVAEADGIRISNTT